MSRPLSGAGELIFQSLVCLFVVIVDCASGYQYLPLEPITTRLNPVDNHFRNHVWAENTVTDTIKVPTTPANKHLFSYFYYKNFNQPEKVDTNTEIIEIERLPKAIDSNEVTSENYELVNSVTESSTEVVPVESKFSYFSAFTNFVQSFLSEEMVQRLLYLLLPEPETSLNEGRKKKNKKHKGDDDEHGEEEDDHGDEGGGDDHGGGGHGGHGHKKKKKKKKGGHGGGGIHIKAPMKMQVKKKYKKFMLPLLLAYKMKFFVMIPVMIGGLLLLVKAAGLAGFFFALFASVIGFKKNTEHS